MGEAGLYQVFILFVFYGLLEPTKGNHREQHFRENVGIAPTTWERDRPNRRNEYYLVVDSLQSELIYTTVV